MKWRKSLISTAVLIGLATSSTFYFDYLFTIKNELDHVNLIELKTDGCELLGSSQNKMTFMAKSPSPTLTLRESIHAPLAMTIVVKNIIKGATPIGLRDAEKWTAHEKGTSGTTLLHLNPDETRTIAFVPPDTNPAFRFAVFGDSEGNDNIFTNRRGSYFVWNNLVSSINQSAALFSIEVGDLVDSGQAYHWWRFKKRVAGFEKPFFPTLGNEDVHPPMGRVYFRALFGRETYAFSHQGCRFILIDNSAKFISTETWDWLESELTTHRAKRKFVFMHIPPLDPSQPATYLESWDAASAKKFCDLMSRSRVEAVFGAHLHSLANGVKDGVAYWITGGAGGKPDRPHIGYHYIEVDVKPGQPIQVEVIPLSNKPFS